MKNNDIEGTLSCWWWECKVIGQMLQNIIFGRETSCQLFDTRRKMHNASTFSLMLRIENCFKKVVINSNKSNLLFRIHNGFIYVTNWSDQMGEAKRLKMCVVMDTMFLLLWNTITCFCSMYYPKSHNWFRNQIHDLKFSIILSLAHK